MNAQVQAINTTPDTTELHDLECVICDRLSHIKGSALALDQALHADGAEYTGAGDAIATMAAEAEKHINRLFQLSGADQGAEHRTTAPVDDARPAGEWYPGDIVIPRRSDQYADLQAAVGILRAIVCDDNDPDQMDGPTRAALEKVLEFLPGVSMEA